MDSKDEVIQKLLAALEPLFGYELALRILEEGVTDYETFLSAPETLKAKVEDMVQSYADCVGLDNLVLRMLMSAPKIMNEVAQLTTSIQETDSKLLKELGCSKSFLDIVLSASIKNPNTTRAEILAIQELDLVDMLFGATGLGRYIQAAEKDNKTISFEENTRMVASSLAHAAETFYKPMVASTLKITRIDQESSACIPNELGAVINQAKDYWKSRYPQLLELIDNKARIIRNSEAHKHTKIDVRKKIIYFYNVPKKGEPEKIDFNEYELAKYVSRFMKLCLGLQASFREAQRRLSV